MQAERTLSYRVVSVGRKAAAPDGFEVIDRDGFTVAGPYATAREANWAKLRLLDDTKPPTLAAADFRPGTEDDYS